MKCVLIGPVYPYRGGIAHYTTMLHRALLARGDDVLLVSFKRQYPRWLFPGESDRDPSAEPLAVVDARYWIDSLNPITWLAAFWRIRRWQPEVIVLPWWTTFWAPAWIVLGALNRLCLRRPLVIVCHNVLPHEARRLDVLLTRWVLRWGTRFVVQSTGEEKRLAALLPGARIEVVPHPVYDMFAEGRMPKEEARIHLGLAPEAPVLLFFGIVREYKGLNDLLDAMPEVCARLEGAILVVAGEFWEDKRLCLERIERLGIADRVIIEDRYIPNEEVPVYFSAADVLVAPYRRVTGSGVVQMARGFGLPAITTVGSEGAATEAGELAGRAVPPGDSQALAAAITDYLKGTPGVAAQGAGPSWDGIVDLIARAASRQ